MKYELKCDVCGVLVGYLEEESRKVGGVLCKEHHDGGTGLIFGFDVVGPIHPLDTKC